MKWDPVYSSHGLKMVLAKIYDYRRKGYFTICVNDWPDSAYQQLLPEELRNEESFRDALERYQLYSSGCYEFLEAQMAGLILRPEEYNYGEGCEYELQLVSGKSRHSTLIILHLLID